MEWWFRMYLTLARALGYAIVWTAHDLTPHEKVFDDDLRARDFLISKSSAVIALSEASARELRALGANEVRVIPIGSYSEPYPVSLTREQARASFDFSDEDVVVAQIGRVEKYKGADLLLQAASRLPRNSNVKILIAGSCVDEDYRRDLTQLLRDTQGRVVAEFGWLQNSDLARYLQAADYAAFPFREVTNSGSILLAQSFGLPVIVPNLPSLDDIPNESAIRFEAGSVASLVDALLEVEKMQDVRYDAMSAAGLAWSGRSDWTKIAQRTIETYRAVSDRRRSLSTEITTRDET
jgi:glycosyltransferase involved in cell wall biosynthesis